MLSIAVALAALACGQGVTDPDMEPAQLEIEASRIKLLTGGDTRLQATVRNRGGQVLPDAAIRWLSIDELTVRVRGNSRAHADLDGAAVGTSVVLASAGAASDSTQVQVVDSTEVADVGFVAPPTSLPVGQAVQLEATTFDAQGAEIRGATFHWSSSDPTVATVTSEGRVEPRSPGVVRIRAEFNGHAQGFDLQISSSQQSMLPAFPGAEGHGAQALSQCRNRSLVHHRVTTTEDSGPGSLRDIIENQVSPYQYDIVTFATGGTITLSKTLTIQTSCLYIAGQTAQGGGIQLVNKPGRAFNTVMIPRNGNIRDIVIRYVRIRTGDIDVDPNANIGDPVGIRSGANIVFDHCSVQFGNDENFEIATIERNGQEIKNISVQWCLISQALGPHSTGVLVTRSDHEPRIERVDFHHNLVAQSAHRMPRFSGPNLSGVRWVNNVVFDWGSRAGRTRDTTGTMTVDYISNYFKAGPRNPETNRYLENETRMEQQPAPSVYLEGNIADPLQLDPSGNQSRLYRWKSLDGNTGTDGAPVDLRATRLPSASIPINIQGAGQAYESTLATVGASQRLDCSGDWVQNRDDLDARVVQNTRSRSGPATRAADMTTTEAWGGIPHLAPGSTCADTDADGMPDDYEARAKLDLTDPTDAAGDSDGDGYLNLEEFINGS